MAGIGVRLNRIYNKNTITTNLVGFGYSTIITVAPMFLVIAAVMVMQIILDYSVLNYFSRELYACTVLYIFVFGLLSASPFNAVLSKYLSDIIYEDRYEDIMPCFYVGLLINTGFSSLLGIPFCLWEIIAGDVPVAFVFCGYCGYMALVLVFYSMLYLSICKDYSKISLFFLIGMLVAVILSLVLSKVFGVNTTYAMIISLDVGFVITGVLEYALVRSYFRQNSGHYKAVLRYFKKYKRLIATNFLYTLGLYIHNFVFWASDLHMVVAKSFVCMPSYDMASCIAMFTNISSSVIFISRVEMNFHERYKAYSEAVIGGRGMDIENAKRRMFDQLKTEVMNLVRIQFIVSVVVYLLCIIFMPELGFGGLILQIYPCLAVGYFILILMYSLIIFLYYFNDLTGSTIAATVFCVSTLAGSVVSSNFITIWYGAGLIFGAFCGFTVAYFRLRYIEKNLDVHIFCNGSLMKHGEGKMPSNLVYDKFKTAGYSKWGKKTDYREWAKMSDEELDPSAIEEAEDAATQSLKRNDGWISIKDFFDDDDKTEQQKQEAYVRQRQAKFAAEESEKMTRTEFGRNTDSSLNFEKTENK
ncbi:MAG: exopolysaccharide Pel transporter PelG [Lachnospiraceae bacterium]|nr:exopolysaccharide Pel transporter PelG [Lachnospiraceae bacterium]